MDLDSELKEGIKREYYLRRRNKRCPKCNSSDIWYSQDDYDYCGKCDFQWTIKPIKWVLVELRSKGEG